MADRRRRELADRVYHLVVQATGHAPFAVYHDRDGVRVLVPAGTRQTGRLQRHLRRAVGGVVRVQSLVARQAAHAATTRGAPRHPDLAVTTDWAWPSFATLGFRVDHEGAQHLVTVRHLDQSDTNHLHGNLRSHPKATAPWAAAYRLESVILDAAAYAHEGDAGSGWVPLPVASIDDLDQLARATGSRVRVRGAHTGGRPGLLTGINESGRMRIVHHTQDDKGRATTCEMLLSSFMTIEQANHRLPPASPGDSGALVQVRIRDQDAAAGMVVAVSGEVQSGTSAPKHFAYAVPLIGVLEALGMSATHVLVPRA